MILTPEEKAAELVKYYYDFQDIDAEYCMIQNAKLCANRLVEEVLGAITEQPVVKYWMETSKAIDAITYI